MSIAQPMPEDFRNTAVAESHKVITQRAREDGRAFADPIEAGVSYCLPTDHDGLAALRRLKWTQILTLVGGFAGLLAGAMIIGSNGGSPGQRPLWTTVLAASCSLTGFCLLFGGVYTQRPIVRRYLRDHLESARARGGSGPIHVSIENSESYQKFKAAPEDIGILILHPETQCLQLEGVSHRYLIYAGDVVELTCTKTQYSEGIKVNYRIGDDALGLTISPNSFWVAFKRHTIGGRSRLFDRIRQTLSLENASRSAKG